MKHYNQIRFRLLTLVAMFKLQYALGHNFKKHLLIIFMIAVAITTNAAEDTEVIVNNINYRVLDPFLTAKTRLNDQKEKEALDWFNKYSELSKVKKLKGEDKKNVKKLMSYIKKSKAQEDVIKLIIYNEINPTKGNGTMPDPNCDYIAICSGSQHAYGDIVIPETITYNENEYRVVEISDNAFNNCEKMRSISLPYSIVKIGSEAFSHCNSLTVMTIPNSVKKIGRQAFTQCISLISINLPDSLTNITNNMLSSCKNLASVTIPNSVTRIGESAFEDCTNLKDVTISKSLYSIGGSAFKNCTNLKYMIIPSSVTSIGERAFENCINLKEMAIPNSVTSIGERAFENCINLKEMAIPNSVTSISFSAFKDCTNLKEITLSESVVEIGTEAFLNCSSLTNVTIPNSTKRIHSNAFRKCANLRSVRWEITDDQLDFSVEDIFKDCINLQTFIFCDGIKRIPDNICRNMYNLENVTIPRSVKKIGSRAFYCCSSLESISIPDSTEEICEEAFMGCINLKNVIIPNSVITINNRAFMGSGLASITIPNSVTKIGDQAFADCFRMNEEVIIPSSVSYMGNDVFGGRFGYESPICIPPSGKEEERITGWALKWYKKALNGDPIALFEMFQACRWGMGVDGLPNSYWVKKLAQNYHPLGWLLLYWFYGDYSYDGNYLKGVSRIEAIKRAVPLAKKGSAEAQFVLYHLQRDKEMLKKSCRQGFSWAIIDYQLSSNDKEAFNRLKQLAQQGHPMAQNNLGDYYLINEDAKQAEFWFKKAIQAGGDFKLAKDNLKKLKR